MKLTLQHVMDATVVIANVIMEKRPMPQKGKYRLARMHAKLFPEYVKINEHRDEMIRAYGARVTVTQDDGTAVECPDFKVPEDKMLEFGAAWKDFSGEEIDIDIEPIPLAQLDLGDGVDGSIGAAELITLGDLVRE